MMRDFTRGIVRENPVFVSLLGLCPSIAITTRVDNAIGLGVAVLVVLTLTSLTVSLMRAVLPARVRSFVYLALIGVFVTVVDLAMQRYLPALSERLGIFVPLIVVNCLLIGRAEAFARRVPVGRAVLDGLGTGLGLLLALMLVALIREVLGAGTITLIPIGGFDGVIHVPGVAAAPAGVVVLGAGAFLVIGYLRAAFNWIGGIRQRVDEPARGVPKEVM